MAQPKRLIGKRFYAYNTIHSAIAAAGTDSKTISVAADSDFYLVKMCMFADIAGAVQTDATRVIPLCTLQLTETSSGNQMFDSAIALNNIFGYGAVPFILPEAKLFQARSTLAVECSPHARG